MVDIQLELLLMIFSSNPTASRGKLPSKKFTSPFILCFLPNFGVQGTSVFATMALLYTLCLSIDMFGGKRKGRKEERRERETTE